ncbi:MAG: hypothetical protein ACE5K7_07925 [Phycisphaerae bacterium]
MSDPGVVERVVLVFAAVAVGGCASRAGPPGEPIDLVWESPPTSQPGPTRRQSRQHGSNKQRSSARPIATVNGQPIDRGQFVQWLIEAHGLSLLQQMMALELVKQAAAEQGITVGRQEVEAEYRRCLSRLYPVDPASPVELSRQQQERALELVLRREGVSRQELMLKVQRDAYVRKLAERELKVDEQETSSEPAPLEEVFEEEALGTTQGPELSGALEDALGLDGPSGAVDPLRIDRGVRTSPGATRGVPLGEEEVTLLEDRFDALSAGTQAPEASTGPRDPALDELARTQIATDLEDVLDLGGEAPPTKESTSPAVSRPQVIEVEARPGRSEPHQAVVPVHLSIDPKAEEVELLITLRVKIRRQKA